MPGGGGAGPGGGAGGGGAAGALTVTDPVISGWISQTKAYVPAFANVQKPAHAVFVAGFGSGGCVPVDGVPAVSVHELGCALEKLTLWRRVAAPA